MLKKKLAIALATAAIVTGVVAATTPSFAAATPAVSFTKIQYNSPGSDNRSNTSLNEEWVRLTNNTRSAVQLKGWTVTDAANHRYTFASPAANPTGSRCSAT